MTTNPKEKDFETKKESDPNSSTKFPSSSRHWSSYKNPRIVRVSRAFGGKDRHSKVCTVRGLRDRRIRLSVPTAIQLYDLQDRLGLSQPSKVIDWLLDVTKHEIDKLPPLPMLPLGNFNNNEPNTIDPFSHFQQTKEREENEQQNHQEGFGGLFGAQNFFPLNNNNNNNYNYNPFNFHWDPQNLSLSQFGGGYSFTNQTYQNPCASLYNSNNITPFPSSYITTPSSVGSNIDLISQIDHFQHQNSSIVPTTLHFITSPMKSLGLNVNSEDFHSREKDNNKGKRTS
ncbi:hypothetical protein ACJIZ3_020766 [Penstemon smallii]|uniref:TCP domain-containing protein n=1 Tax=Penstemon smallii TaxID=265156 RepID=A0ABD3SKB8_9LAMI